MLNITKKIENKKALFALEGRLDTVTAPQLEKELGESNRGADTFDFDTVMDDFQKNIAILRKNFYKEEYLK